MEEKGYIIVYLKKGETAPCCVSGSSQGTTNISAATVFPDYEATCALAKSIQENNDSVVFTTVMDLSDKGRAKTDHTYTKNQTNDMKDTKYIRKNNNFGEFN